MQINMPYLYSEIKCILDVLVERDIPRINNEQRIKLRGWMMENEWEKMIEEMGGQAFLNPQEDSLMESLGELICMGLAIREGFIALKKE